MDLGRRHSTRLSRNEHGSSDIRKNLIGVGNGGWPPPSPLRWWFALTPLWRRFTLHLPPGGVNPPLPFGGCSSLHPPGGRPVPPSGRVMGRVLGCWVIGWLGRVVRLGVAWSCDGLGVGVLGHVLGWVGGSRKMEK